MGYAGAHNINRAYTSKEKEKASARKARAKAIAKRYAETPQEEGDYDFHHGDWYS